MTVALVFSQISAALTLFFLVNWIGKHAIDFGYTSATLFEAHSESAALNFFLRVLSPAVFIIALSAGAVAAGYPALRMSVHQIPYYYYTIRLAAIFLLNRQGLISWPRFVAHAVIGILVADLAFQHLIVPNRSLLPDLNSAGNELWLAILAFLYAVANKVPLPTGPGVRRRNAFVRRHFVEAERRFGRTISKKLPDETLQLIAYAVLIYEDYCRPPAIRTLERILWWKPNRTTGIMQVAAPTALSDEASVESGTDILAAAWARSSADDIWTRVRTTIAVYNRDEDYIGRVMEVMEILAKRVAPRFQRAYEIIWE